MPLIREEIIAQVIDRCDIVDVISSYIPLKRAGKNFKAVCPFHHEKTPSFVVNPQKQIFHCFGCGIGGNVVSFVMKQERMDFPEAVRMLAQKANVTIPDDERPAAPAENIRQAIFKVNALAVNFFHKNLLSDKTPPAKHARQYLNQRGVDQAAAHAFQLGFAPEGWDGLLSYLKKEGVGLSLMEKAGLIIPRENAQGYYDRFRNRVVFPIFDTRAHCRAFGARALGGDSGAKYLNSPETLIYTKGHHLYGFHLAKPSIAENDFVVIVEGYLDCLIPYQAGVTNIVASLGTALTVEQIRLIRRYTHNVVMLFDADAAGESAMMRSLDGLIEEGMDVRVAVLEAGEDPDSFTRRYGAEALKERIRGARQVFEYKLGVLCRQYDTASAEGKAQVATQMFPTLRRFPSELVKAEYIKKLAGTLKVSDQVLLEEYKKSGTALPQKVPAALRGLGDRNQARERAVERSLLKLILAEEGLISQAKEEVVPSDFQDERIRTAVSRIYEWFEQGRRIETSSLINSFEDASVQQIIAGVMAEEDILGDRQKIYRDCIGRMKHDKLRIQRRRLMQQIQEAEAAGDAARVGELMRQFNQHISR